MAALEIGAVEQHLVWTGAAFEAVFSCVLCFVGGQLVAWCACDYEHVAAAGADLGCVSCGGAEMG